MADSHKALITRILSAVLWGAGVLASGYFGGRVGLSVVVLVAMVLGIREYSRLLFPGAHVDPAVAPALKWFFYALCVGLTAGLAHLHVPSGEALALAMALLIVGSIWLTRNRLSNENLLQFITLAAVGLLYCVFFPIFALFISELDRGGLWMLFLLLVVFFGDTFAYFGGRFLGRKKLMPKISPNKTVEGALSGIVGSCLAGLLVTSLGSVNVSAATVIVFGTVCGFTAQAGDLFLSLIKRVAQVKDSGHIMPGHGGILDRLDGVFIACPLVYAFALYCQSARIF